MIQDLRYALRQLGKHPGFAAVAVITLALGIGANGAIFSVVDAYLVRAMPYPHADRQVVVNDVQPNYGKAPASFLEWQDLKEDGRMFEALSAAYAVNVNYAGGELPERLRMLLVDGSFFAIAGQTRVAGRLFVPEEEREGGAPAVIAGESFWRTHLGGRASAIGQVIRLDAQPYTLVGVVTDPAVPATTPIALYTPLQQAAPWRDRGTHYLYVRGLLPEGTRIELARSEIEALAKRLQESRGTDHGWAITPLRQALVGSARGILLALQGAVGFVLLIAAANVANLLLVRAAGRGGEFAVRLALGASRWHVVRQLLAESLVLGAVGAGLGALLGVWGTNVLATALPSSGAAPGNVTFDLRVLGFTVAVGMAAALLAGVVPALFELRRAPAAGMAGARAAGASGRARRLRGGLVIAEFALSLVLLVGAALMLQSFRRLLNVDPGFRPGGLLTLSVNLPTNRYTEGAQRLGFVEDLTARLERVAGVTGVAVANDVPLSGGGMNGGVTVEGRTFTSSERPNAEKRIVSESYFQVLGIPLRRGRLFTPADRAGSPNVVVVSEATAQRLWPGENALGKHIRSLACNSDCWEEVVGVVGDVREEALYQAAALEVYYPIRQLPLSSMDLMVRTTGDPVALVQPVRRAVAGVDPLQPVFNVRTMQDIVSASVADRRLTTFLLTAFAMLAIVLAAVGIGGVLSYAVGQRTREIGLRMALGSAPGSVVRLVVRQGLWLAGLGLAIGLPAALVLVRALRAQLYEIAPSNPLAYVVGVAVLTIVALGACYLPARRAARVAPMEALRYE